MGNLSYNATKEDADGVITSVLEKISEECKADGCGFTAPLATKVKDTFGELHQRYCGVAMSVSLLDGA